MARMGDALIVKGWPTMNLGDKNKNTRINYDSRPVMDQVKLG